MKFAGMVGFELYSENVPGVYSATIVEKPYKGTVEQETRRLYSSDETTNKDINIDNRIKIVGNPYALLNHQKMRFVEYMGTCWTIKTIDVRNYPSMLLYLGGVYNGERQTETNETP